MCCIVDLNMGLTFNHLYFFDSNFYLMCFKLDAECQEVFVRLLRQSQLVGMRLFLNFHK